MRKIIAISLVAILAVGSVFAAFSGSASVGFGGNLDKGNFGFIDQSTNLKVDLELSTQDGANEASESNVYASIKGSLAVKLFNGEGGQDASSDPQFSSTYPIAVVADIEEATIGGENWYVSVLGMPDGPDYAKSAMDTYTVEDAVDKWGFTKDDYDKNATYAAPYASTNGVEVGVYGYKFGLGLLGDYGKDWKFENSVKLAGYVETPEYDLNGVKLQAATVYSYDGFKELKDGVLNYGDKGPDTYERTNGLGLSGKVSFENDTIKASLATDFGLDFTKTGKEMVGADVAANFTYDFVTVDAYYATSAKTGETPKTVLVDTWDPIYGKNVDESENKNEITGYTKGEPEEVTVNGTNASYSAHLLSAQAKFDLNSFNVPVALTLGVKDIIAKQDIALKVEVTAVEGLTITAKGGYVVDANGRDKDGNIVKNDKLVGKWSTGADVKYTCDAFTVSGGVSVAQKLDAKKAVTLGASASVSTKALVPGAELKFAWANANDLLKTHVDPKNKTDLGKITASIKVEF